MRFTFWPGANQHATVTVENNDYTPSKVRAYPVRNQFSYVPSFRHAKVKILSLPLRPWLQRSEIEWPGAYNSAHS
jgi:hypothetical protein